MKKISLFLLMISLLAGCSKMEEKKTAENNKNEGMPPHPPITGSNSQTDSKSSGQKDEKASELVKLADDSYTKYSSDKSEGNKKEVVKNCMAAANYLMFEAGLPAKEKYRPALKYYRQVLEVDPKNSEAMTNKKQIEDIYESMGMPIPQ